MPRNTHLYEIEQSEMQHYLGSNGKSLRGGEKNVGAN